MWPCGPSPWGMALRPRVSWWSKAQNLLDWASRSEDELLLKVPTTPSQTFHLLCYHLCKLTRNKEADEIVKGTQESLEVPHSPRQHHCPHLNPGICEAMSAQSRQSPDEKDDGGEHTHPHHSFMHWYSHPTLSGLCRHRRASWSSLRPHCPWNLSEGNHQWERRLGSHLERLAPASGANHLSD